MDAARIQAKSCVIRTVSNQVLLDSLYDLGIAERHGFDRGVAYACVVARRHLKKRRNWQNEESCLKEETPYGMY